MKAVQLTFRFKPEPEHLLKLIKRRDLYLKSLRVKELVESAMQKINEGKRWAELNKYEQAAVKTLVQLRHKMLSPFADERRCLGKYSADHLRYLKNLEKLITNNDNQAF